MATHTSATSTTYETTTMADGEAEIGGLDLEALSLSRFKRIGLYGGMMDEGLHAYKSDEDYECYDENPAGERWPPLGANDLDEDHEIACCDNGLERNCEMDTTRLHDLEEQQELLNSSLIALTSHFAQVQFRLRQIVDAPPSEKEMLLKDLEAFAFRGIPEIGNSCVRSYAHASQELVLATNNDDIEDKVFAQKAKQKELISQLKDQLEDLEKYAYETGEAGLPQSVIMEKQRVIIDQLKGKMNLNLDTMDKLTIEDLRSQVDYAVSQLVSPLKMKEHLVTQLKTQISDLERFIEFLQGDSTSANEAQCSCNCSVHNKAPKKKGVFLGKMTNKSDHEIHAETMNIMKKIITLIQMFTLSQFGCGSEHFRRNTLKKTMKANHWGDLRAELEISVNCVLQLSYQCQAAIDSDYMSDSEDSPIILCNAKITTAVRKQLAISVKNLMHHGLVPVAQTMSVAPFVGCFPQLHEREEKLMHPWELVLKYYEMKNGERYNSTPARKLSQSFNLDIVGGTAISNKQHLLSIIETVVTSHLKYKRSYDSHFKAFICAALNSKRLVPWLRLIFRNQHLLGMYYQPWSYVAKTGFEDSLQSLDRLSEIKFELPVDLAVRQFQNIKDAF